MNQPEWILLKTVLAIHSMQLAEHGGRDGVLDMNGLQSAIDSPRNHYLYVTGIDIPRLAAQYAFALARNQVFADGNKRTAAVVCETFMLLNGFAIEAPEEELYEIYIQLAEGEINAEQMSDWIREHSHRI